MKKAFTLVELIIVVIIIGILASIAIPQFNKTMERSRIAEASAVLGAIRGAQLRYKLENPAGYALDYTKLDIDLPNYDSSLTSPNGKFLPIMWLMRRKGQPPLPLPRPKERPGVYTINIY